MPSPKTPSLSQRPLFMNFGIFDARSQGSKKPTPRRVFSRHRRPLKRHVVDRICELEAQLGSTELTTLRNT